MRLTTIVVLTIFFLCIKSQPTPTPNYYCDQDDDTVEFTLSVSDHSAWNLASNCALQECQVNSNDNETCRSSMTLCFDYRTVNNSSYCAPGILCSILEPCNISTYTCESHTSICIINSCCSPQPVCLPLAWTDFCILVSETTTTTTMRTTTTTSSSISTTSSTTTVTPIKSTSSTTSISSTTSSRTTSSTSKTTSTTSRTSTTTTITPSSTTPIATSITTAYSCGGGPPGSLTSIHNALNTSWIQYTFNYTANKVNPMLMFGIDASLITYIALDDVSVVNTVNSSFQLLKNPSFENSTTTPTGWAIWCSSTCYPGTGGSIMTSNCRTNNCYKSQCAGGDLDYLVQTFAATIGQTYTISFWSQRVKYIVGGSSVTLYYGVI